MTSNHTNSIFMLIAELPALPEWSDIQPEVQAVIAAIIAAAVIGSIVYAVDSHATRRREERKKREQTMKQRQEREAHQVQLREAPRKFNDCRVQMEAWLPQCAKIVTDEAQTGQAYDEGSASGRVREKSLKFIEGTKRQAELLFDDDITEDRYEARKLLRGLQAACAECKMRNQGKTDAVCLALEEGSQSVELTFKL